MKFPKKNILFVINSFEIGGSEKQLLNLLTNFNKQKLNISLFALNINGSLKNKYFNLPINVINHNNNFIKKYYYLYKYLKKNKNSIVHCFLSRSYLLIFLMSFFCKIRYLILSRRSRNFYQKKNIFISFFERLAHKKTNKFLCNSREIIADLLDEGVSINKINLVYNGIDLELIEQVKKKRNIFKKQKIHQNKIKIICVANFYEYKGHKDLIESLNNIRDIFIEKCHLILIGNDRGSKKSIISLLSKYKLSNYVTIIDNTIDVYPYLLESDIGVLLSHQEGFSNSILEYMLSSLCVVATDVGSNKMLLSHDIKNIVEVGNIELIAKTLKKCIIKSNRDRFAIGNKSRQIVKDKFNIKNITLEYHSIYEDIKT